jgi:ketosteroid isomerase-like protein
MSENLDLARSIYAAWERGEWGRGDWASPDIEYEYVGGPEPRSGTGLAGLASVMRDWLGAWEDWRVEVVECRDIDGEHVLVTGKGIGRGKTSGLKVESRGANLFRLRDGKVTRLVSYWDRDDAFADLGLVE